MWRSYLQFHIRREEFEEAKVRGNSIAMKVTLTKHQRIYFRAIRAVPFSKSVWLLCTELRFNPVEIRETVQLMVEKELRLRLALSE